MAARRRNKGSTDANAAASYTPATAPGSWSNGDTLTFDEGANTNFNVSMTALQALDLGDVKITSGCKDNIGSAANPLKLDISGTLTDEGGGEYSYIAGGTATGIIDNIVFNPSNPNKVLYLSSVAIADTIYVLGGTFIVGGSVTLVNIVANGPCSIVIPEDGSDVLGNVTVTGGARAIIKRRIAGTWRAGAGGTITYNVDTTTDTGDGVIDGGTFELIKGSCSIDGQRGTFDWSKLEKAGGYTVVLSEYPELTEKTGPVEPTTFTRTKIGRGSRKV